MLRRASVAGVRGMMGVMISILSFLRRLWVGLRPARKLADGAEVSLQHSGSAETEPEPATAPLATPIEAPCPLAVEADDDEADDDPDEAHEADEDIEGGGTPDPFATLEQPEPTSRSEEAIEISRRDARALALMGPQKLNLNTAAGPGSLAEALNDLLREGRVSAEFCDDGQDEPHILYRPLH
jgi:hypothetical protein